MKLLKRYQNPAGLLVRLYSYKCHNGRVAYAFRICGMKGAAVNEKKAFVTKHLAEAAANNVDHVSSDPKDAAPALNAKTAQCLKLFNKLLGNYLNK